MEGKWRNHVDLVRLLGIVDMEKGMLKSDLWFLFLLFE